MSPRPRDFKNKDACPHRLAASHLLIRVANGSLALAAFTLPRPHPARVFIKGRRSEVCGTLMRSTKGQHHRLGVTTLALLALLVLLLLFSAEPFWTIKEAFGLTHRH